MGYAAFTSLSYCSPTTDCRLRLIRLNARRPSIVKGRASSLKLNAVANYCEKSQLGACVKDGGQFEDN